MVNLEWYRSFAAIYKIGTITGAAETLYMTQPGVSQHLSALETLMGHKLFIRAPRKMVPTEYGKELYSQLIGAIEGLERVEQKFKRISKELPLIRIGTPLEYFHQIALHKLKNTIFRFWFQFDITAKLIEKLEKGDLDIVIATQTPGKKDFEFAKLADESFLLVGASDISLPNFKKGKREEQNNLYEHWLTNQKWITYSANLPIIRRFWLENFKKRPNIQPAMVIPNLHSIKKAVELGLGISLLPDYLCSEELNKNKIKLLWKGGTPIKNEIFLVYRKIDRNNEMIMQIKAELLKSR